MSVFGHDAGPYFELLPWVGGVVATCWLLSIVTRNYSWVDRAWSLLPPVYVTFVAWRAGFADPRLDLMAALTVLWGARLTYNFARKGGYRLTEEDYRWAELRKRMPPAAFQVFNATFIAPYQNVILYALAAPAHVAWARRGTPIGVAELALAALFLVLLAGETIADQQQWRFHEAKARARARGETLDPPFFTRGLFRFSRHPNFFCEIAMWWTFAGFAIRLSGGPTWAIVGAFLLHTLFLGSTAFTEKITLGRYPTYRDYQKSTSRLVPWAPPRAWNAR